MSRFLFATFGSLGDLHPYIAISKALIERGHKAVIATIEEYQNTIEGAGVEFARVRPNMSELGDFPTLIARLFDTHRGMEYLMRNLVMQHARTAYEHLLEASDGADLLVSHPLAVTLPLVAEHRKLPWASTVLAPMSLLSALDPPVIAGLSWLKKIHKLGHAPYRMLINLLKKSLWSWEAPLRKLKYELGFPQTKEMAMFEGQFSSLCNLALFDSQLAKPQSDWPINTHLCGAALYDGCLSDNDIIEEFEKFLADGDPPVVFALGSSVVWFAENFWNIAAAALRKTGLRAIFITGPVIPAKLPDGIKAFPYLPYSMVFPRASVIAHQGGAGTLAQAMRAGRPQLILPVAFDQPDNAQRAKSLGVGRVLPFGKVTSGKLALEIELILSNSDYTRNARTISNELSGTNGAAFAADRLIECVR